MPSIRSPRSLRTSVLAGALALLLGASASAEGFAEPSAELPDGPDPAPYVSHYTPLPASYDATITLHGTNLLPPPVPEVTVQESVPKTFLFWGNSQKYGLIPKGGILSWTDTSIQINGLAAPQGVYGIILIRGGEIVSNFNRTLLLAEGPPLGDESRTLREAGGPGGETIGQLGKHPLGLIEPVPTDVAKDFFIPEDTLLRADYGPDHPYSNLQQPEGLEAWVASYAPAIVGSNEEIAVNGYFPISENRRLVFGVLANGVRSVKPEMVKSWNANAIVLHPGAVPMGVWWLAVFSFDVQAQQVTLVSNLNTGLQVTENPPQSDPNSLNIVEIVPGSSQQGGQSQQAPDHRIQIGPHGEPIGGAREIHPSAIRQAPATAPTLEPRVQKLSPKTGAPAEVRVQPAQDAPEKAAPSEAPAGRLQPPPAPAQPEIQQRVIRKLP